MNTTATADQVVDRLVSEGHSSDDVLAAIDSLILAGGPTGEDDTYTADDIEILRDQLNY